MNTFSNNIQERYGDRYIMTPLKDFPAPHIPNRLPMPELVHSLCSDTVLLAKTFKATSKLSEFIGYLINLPSYDVLLTSLSLQEAVLSSKIEGTLATIEDVIKDQPETDTIKNDIIEILNYTSAIDFGHQELLDNNKPRKISTSLICNLHKLLLENNVRGASKHPGNFKREQNYIKNSKLGNFTPISPILTSEYMENLAEYINNYDEASALIQAAVIHAQFELIHPFEDGNGRIGRLLVPLFLFYKNTIPFPIFYISRFFANNDDAYKQYLSNLSKDNNYELDAWKSWITFFLDGVIEESTNHIETSKRLLALYEEMINSVKLTDHINIVKMLFTQLRVSPNEVVSSLGISKATAYRVLKTLADNGYLEKTGSERKTNYVFTKLIQVI